MLHDRAKIHVRAGAGGDGSMSFRREAHVPRGGPDGGDGGRGGDVVLVCDDSLRDLQAFRRRVHHRARRGGHGQGALRHGADGEPLVIRVPPGTEAIGLDGTRHELLEPDRRVVVARGGVGGRGNKRFAGPTRQAPRFAERGLPGDEGWIELRLRLLADVGLIGLPNAGKSSLLRRLTRADPKVADYPFTTLEPVLGTVDLGDRQLVIADIPGLIEGASRGAGLGHDFLARLCLGGGWGARRRPTTRASRPCPECWRSPRPTSSPRPSARRPHADGAPGWAGRGRSWSPRARRARASTR
jgi:GTP-binding protein